MKFLNIFLTIFLFNCLSYAEEPLLCKLPIGSKFRVKSDIVVPPKATGRGFYIDQRFIPILNTERIVKTDSTFTVIKTVTENEGCVVTTLRQ